VKIPQVPSFSRLCLCVDKTVDGTIGDKDHHAAPEQVGENVTKGTVNAHNGTPISGANRDFRQEKLLSSGEERVYCRRQRKITLETQPNSDT